MVWDFPVMIEQTRLISYLGYDSYANKNKKMKKKKKKEKETSKQKTVSHRELL